MALERLLLKNGGAEAEVVPQRGGIVSRFRVGDIDVLYLDETTLKDESRNVRGGIPILFPTAGRLTDDTYRYRKMKQHGFARNLPWKVASVSQSEVVLVLNSTRETQASFPYEFRLEFTYRLSRFALRIEQKVRNLSNERMPLHMGFHPYLRVPDKDKGQVAISTRATRVYDNVLKSEGPFTGFDLTKDEVDLHLVDHGSSSCRLRRRDAAIEVAGSPEYKRWVVWTVQGRDFVCVEPWTAPADALNTGEGLIWLDPDQTKEMWIQIGLE